MTTDPKDATTTLIVGYSNDAAGDHALAVAADLGRRLPARIHVVHVVDIHDYPVDIDTAGWEEQCRQELAEQRGRVAHMLTDLELDWTYEARRGDPAAELAQAAEEHDALLIVVGTRGEGLRLVIPRLVEPSVSHGVIHCQPRPVVVVPAPETHPGTAPVDS
jgi:nucleotide-binding universal stress UspA family protein